MKLFTYIFCILFLQTFSFAQQIGTNDFQISTTGSNGDRSSEAKNTDVAYNSANKEYLVVWASNQNREYEIWTQRYSAVNGMPIGSSFKVSDMGPDNSDSYGANAPAVTYNSTNNEYLVVWYGDNDEGAVVRNEAEIWGQRIDAATGKEIGPNDFRISNMGPDGNPAADGRFPDVIHNSKNNEYLVVWYGDAFFDEKNEIWGQLVTATGTQKGKDFRISFMGSNGDITYGGYDPAVTYNSTNNEYLVVWFGSQAQGELVAEEYEIWGQRITSAGKAIGTKGFRISDLGDDGVREIDAKSPEVVYNSKANEYLVVWAGNINSADYRIFGQRLTASNGNEIGSNDFQIGTSGPDNVLPSQNHVVDVSYNETDNQYLVVWNAHAYNGQENEKENEIFGIRLYGITGNSIDAQEFRISDMGQDGNANFDAERPALAYNAYAQEFLVTWQGDDDSLGDEDFEIWGQRLNFGGMPPAPSCTDGIQNGTETDVDCGGTSCPACVVPTCEDGIRNGNEVGIDCGGTNCPACPEPTCTDGIQNGTETNIDCGGTNCPACPIICNTPTGLNTNSITATRATLTWIAVPEATNYTVEYRVVGVETWTVRSVTKNRLGIKSLTANTTYEWHVRSNCEGGSSPWSELSTFTTTASSGTIENRNEEEINQDIVIYPNPTSDMLHLDKLNELMPSTIILHNLLGCVMAREVIQSSQHSLVTKFFPKGIYTLTVINGNTRWQQKIVLQ